MPGRETQNAGAAAFRAMHHGPAILVLPNAWDAASARIFEEAGFGAIASTSAGVAFAMGYPDGEKIPRDEMLAQVARIARSVNIAVTADVEAGYGRTPDAAALTATAVIESGAVGMNFEDATGNPGQPLLDLSLQLERIHAVREGGERSGVPLVLNARTDVYLLQVGPPETRYDETVHRLSAYRGAGADCVFAPGVKDPEIIARLVRDLKCPLNILAVPGAPSIPELRELGVARVSVGSGPIRATLGLLKDLAIELRERGTYRLMEKAPPHADINRLMGARRNP